MEDKNYEIDSREGLYYIFGVLFSILIYGTVAVFLYISYMNGQLWFYSGLIAYIVAILVAVFIRSGFLIGYIKGNGVRVSEKQFPEIFESLKQQSDILGIKNSPRAYVLQAGGTLNAFAKRFVGGNYIVLYSDIAEEVFLDNKEAVDFVITHELGHIKRNHSRKLSFLLPSFIVPFFFHAYSRACERTCDNIGAALSPEGVMNGMLLLAAGKKLYKRVDIETYIQQTETEAGFWPWITEKLSTHPRLSARMARFNTPEYTSPKKKFSVSDDYKSDDHSKYFPS